MIYHLELAQPNYKSYKIITLFMAFLNAVSFIFYFLNAESSFLNMVSATGIIASVVLFYIVFIKLAVWKKGYKVVALILILMAICWAFAGNFYFFFLFIILSLFSFISLQPTVILVNDEGIKYPSFPAKFYQWFQVNQVLIKDDVLSIDLIDNKFLQFLLPAESVSKIIIADFNSFCKTQVLASSTIEK